MTEEEEDKEKQDDDKKIGKLCMKKNCSRGNAKIPTYKPKRHCLSYKWVVSRGQTFREGNVWSLLPAFCDSMGFH